MHRENMSPSAASLCAILSTTDLIVLVMLCRARSEADPARRLRPPSPTARESSLVSASISCSACSARSTFPRSLASSSSSRSSESRRFKRPWLARRASRLHHPDCRYECQPFRDPDPRAASRGRSDRFRHLGAGLQFHLRDRAHGIRPGMTEQMGEVREPFESFRRKDFPR